MISDRSQEHISEIPLGSNQVCRQRVENKQRHAINIASHSEGNLAFDFFASWQPVIAADDLRAESSLLRFVPLVPPPALPSPPPIPPPLRFLLRLLVLFFLLFLLRSFYFDSLFSSHGGEGDRGDSIISQSPVLRASI